MEKELESNSPSNAAACSALRVIVILTKRGKPVAVGKTHLDAWGKLHHDWKPEKTRKYYRSEYGHRAVVFYSQNTPDQPR